MQGHQNGQTVLDGELTNYFFIIPTCGDVFGTSGHLPALSISHITFTRAQCPPDFPLVNVTVTAKTVDYFKLFTFICVLRTLKDTKPLLGEREHYRVFSTVLKFNQVFTILG